MDINIKEVKIMMHMCLQNMPEVNTKAEIADFINRMIVEDPEFFGQIDEEDILDIREYTTRSTKGPSNE
jgi:hypothetical protein